MSERRRYLRDVSVQTIGTVLGGLLLIVAAKVGGLLGDVNWNEVGRTALSSAVLIAGVLALAALYLSGRKEERELKDPEKRRQFLEEHGIEIRQRDDNLGPSVRKRAKGPDA